MSFRSLFASLAPPSPAAALTGVYRAEFVGPAYPPVANAAARTFASHSDGEPGNVILDALANLSFTAHI
jgi:hypothetical protein